MRAVPTTLLLALLITGAAAAAELPKRKPGLWEIDTRMAGMPSLGAAKQCIDHNTDDLMMQRARKEKSDCSVMDIRSANNRITVHSVCRLQGSTATTDAVFSGSFDSSYQGQINTRYQPPFMGMSETRMSQEGRWIGPCTAGLKPGDVVMPNSEALNEIMKDPRVQEMMKRPK